MSTPLSERSDEVWQVEARHLSGCFILRNEQRPTKRGGMEEAGIQKLQYARFVLSLTTNCTLPIATRELRFLPWRVPAYSSAPIQ